MERTASGLTLGRLFARHIGTAMYLLGAEIRFKAYCVVLYYRKRPYLADVYAGTAAASMLMYALAGLAVELA